MAEGETHDLPLESADPLTVTKCPQGGAAMPEEEEMERAAATKARKLFNKRAPLYDFLFRKLIDFAPVFRDFFYDRDLLASDMKVLDAGTGTGLLTRILYPMGREKGLSNIVFHAFDLTPAMLDVFHNWIRKEGAEEAVSTRIQDVLHLDTLPETWNDYDLVVTVAMLEYIPRPSLHKAVAGLLGRLKPGGKMILFLSGRTPLMRFFLGWLWRSNLYTKSELDVVLEKAGATDVEYLPFPVRNPYLTKGGYMLVVQIARTLE
jgi:SAM-dependent methyltransferase